MYRAALCPSTSREKIVSVRSLDKNGVETQIINIDPQPAYGQTFVFPDLNGQFSVVYRLALGLEYGTAAIDSSRAANAATDGLFVKPDERCGLQPKDE
jgi:hypothetical protein